MDDPRDRLATLVPQPTAVRPRAGQLEIATRPAVHAGRGTGADKAASVVGRALAAIPWPGADTEGGESAASVTVHVVADLGPESYRLVITSDGVTLAAGGVAGAFYAVQTIHQLLPDDAWRLAPPDGGWRSGWPPAGARRTGASRQGARADAWRLPAVEIEDRPALSWRGAHIDVARHFFPKRELFALIDALAAVKLNRLHLHLTDDQGWRVESRSFPALHEVGSHRPRSQISLNSEQPRLYQDVPHGGYYTLADLSEIAAFAADRMMALVPEIDLPGHSAALLAALPELGAGQPPPGGYQVSTDWGIRPYLVAALPEARDALAEVLAEIVDATAAIYVHIGGDECVLDAWRSDPRVEAYRRERGLSSAEDLHAAFLRDIADMLAADFGARSVVWDEGFSSAAGRSRLRADTIVMAWRGMPIARAAAEAGHDVVATPVFPTYFDYNADDSDAEPVAIGGPVRLEDVAAFSPVPADWPEQARSHLIGTQFQLWTEYIPDGRALEYMAFPRGCALADVAWTGRPAGWHDGVSGAPSLATRMAAHLGRLDAAGVEYRPLAGPRPWQQGGTGPRRHRPGYPVHAVTEYLDQIASAEQA